MNNRVRVDATVAAFAAAAAAACCSVLLMSRNYAAHIRHSKAHSILYQRQSSRYKAQSADRCSAQWFKLFVKNNGSSWLFSTVVQVGCSAGGASCLSGPLSTVVNVSHFAQRFKKVIEAQVSHSAEWYKCLIQIGHGVE